MTNITDRHTLRRMSWSELTTAAQDAELKRDYDRQHDQTTVDGVRVLFCIGRHRGWRHHTE